jgi:hypothetical protein
MNASTTNETVTYDAILASGETLELWLVDGEGNGEWFEGTLADAVRFIHESGETVGVYFDDVLLAIVSEDGVCRNETPYVAEYEAWAVITHNARFTF